MPMTTAGHPLVPLSTELARIHISLIHEMMLQQGPSQHLAFDQARNCDPSYGSAPQQLRLDTACANMLRAPRIEAGRGWTEHQSLEPAASAFHRGPLDRAGDCFRERRELAERYERLRTAAEVGLRARASRRGPAFRWRPH